MKTLNFLFILTLAFFLIGNHKTYGQGQSTSTTGVETDIYSAYLSNWHLADDTKYYKITTQIPFTSGQAMTSFQIDYWGYQKSWQVTLGFYVFGSTNFSNPSAEVKGLYDFDHIYLGTENVSGTEYVTILIPNTAIAQYGNITVNSLTSARSSMLNSSWNANWSGSIDVDVSTESNIYKLDFENKISSNDNIGIGTFDPIYPLQVENGDMAHFSRDTEGTFRTGTDEENNLELNVGEQNAYLEFRSTPDADSHTMYIGTQSSDVGVDNDNDIQFQTDGETKMTVLDNGNVGIGTASPSELLHVQQNDNASGTETTIFNLEYLASDNKGAAQMRIHTGGYTNGTTIIEQIGSGGLNGADFNDFNIKQQYGGTDAFGNIGFFTGGSERVTIIGGTGTTAGNVGIGTNDPGDYKLAVEGQIGARSIKVTNAAWADYVFAPSYQLMPLSEVETYITQNQHLPNIPSAKEVEENGFVLEEMDAKLMEKIEELTLYMIEQQKQIEKQNQEIQNLKKQLNKQ